MRDDRKIRAETHLDMLKQCLKRVFPTHSDDHFDAIVEALDPGVEKAGAVRERIGVR
ncbi:hypothetical protein ACWPM1_11795 [Tsuneonella sp. HG249]